MSHASTTKDQFPARARRSAGRIAAIDRAIAKAIAGEAGCAVVPHRMADVRGAVLGLMDERIDDHVREHMAPPRLSEAARAEGAEALTTAIRRYAKQGAPCPTIMPFTAMPSTATHRTP